VTAPTKAAKPGQFAASSGQLATFRLDGDLYGVEVEHVQEVLKSQGLPGCRWPPPPWPG
jgi:purine-binding chemotaxis protein CheW